MTYSEFKTYIEGLGTSNVDIVSTVFADPYDGLQQLMNGKSTPLLFVESPDGVLEGDDITTRKIYFDTELIVFDLLSKDATPAQKTTVKNSTFEIMLEFVAKLQQDIQDGTVGYLQMQSTIRQVQYNRYAGWAIKLTIGDDRGIAINAAKWT